MTSKVTSATVSEVKFASVTENINSLTLDDIKKGFAGCSGEGIPMTSANFNAVLNWITENIGLQEDIVVETIKGKKYLITKAKDGSRAKIEISKLIEKLRDSGVVTTDDFGDGLKFNPETSKYDVALGKSLTFNKNGDIDIKSNPSGGVVINNDGLAELALSKDDGNLLEIRKDGLYYGSVAEEELQNLYVSSSQGNDSNTGTRESPLRTIQAAVDKVKDTPAYYIIHLYRGDTFDWVDKILNHAQLYFRVYGMESTHPSSTPENPYYRGYLAKDFPRPIVNVRVREAWGFMKRMHLESARITVEGVHFKINNTAENDNGTLAGHFSGILTTYNGETQLWGCIIELIGGAKALSGIGSYRTDSLTRCKSLVMNHCSIPVPLDKFQKDGSATDIEHLGYGPLGPSIAVVSHEPDNRIDGFGGLPDRDIFTNEDVIRNLTIETVCSAIGWDRDKKTIFGATVNWDIFK